MAIQTKHNDVIFHVGDIVRVHYRIIEREKVAGKTKRSIEVKVKERVQPFEGIVIGIKGSAENKSFTVRRLADQKIGVERVFPIMSPWIEKIEVKQRGKARRSKLYYLRTRGNLEVKRILPKTKKSKNKSAKKATISSKSKSGSSLKKKGNKGRTPRKTISSK